MSKIIEAMEKKQKLLEKESHRISRKLYSIWDKTRKLQAAAEKRERKACKGKYYYANFPGNNKVYLHFTSAERADVVRLQKNHASISEGEELFFYAAYHRPSTKAVFEKAFAKALKKITAKK